MLTKKQIKIMTKPYTNKTIINKGTKTVMGKDWWGNGHIVFLEIPPAVKDYPKNWDSEDCMDATERIEDTLNTLIAVAKTPVYPVEIRPNHSNEYAYTKPLAVLRFTDGNGLTIWADARYVAAIQKRHRKKQELTWTADYATGVLVAHNGKPVATLMRLSQPEAYEWDEEPTWNLKNEWPPE